MRKPLYNIVIFIFHIITLILLFTLCIHFNVIKLDFLDFSKEAVASFFKNDYVVTPTPLKAVPQIRTAMSFLTV